MVKYHSQNAHVQLVSINSTTKCTASLQWRTWREPRLRQDRHHNDAAPPSPPPAPPAITTRGPTHDTGRWPRLAPYTCLYKQVVKEPIQYNEHLFIKNRLPASAVLALLLAILASNSHIAQKSRARTRPWAVGLACAPWLVSGGLAELDFHAISKKHISDT